MASFLKLREHGFIPFCILIVLCFVSVSMGLAQKLVTHDFGDAPDSPYPTWLNSNGARHVYNPDYYLGSKIDKETDGQPNSTATGDDNDVTSDDEDGVKFTSDIKPGQTASVTVTASTLGKLNAWMDFNGDGDWADNGEQIFTDKDLTNSSNALTFSVPGNASTGYTFTRFRFSVNGKISYTGEAPEGEVEDYRVQIKQTATYDYGDAPDTPYPTKNSSGGARHVYNSDVFLGNNIDVENDGQPDASAKGDDTAGTPDDEDGVSFTSDIIAGQTASVDVKASTSGNLNAWIDFNGDGDWDDTGEQIYNDKSLSGGTNSLTYSVPSVTFAGSSFARFRFSLNGGISYRGDASDGEVEDYKVKIKQPQQPSEYDFGDAPDPAYPTKLSNGARHVYNPDVFLGTYIDVELDGQPTPDAKGDDTNGTPDDEDGVSFTSDLTAGHTAKITVTASTSGNLNAWVDFNADGDWADKGEQIFSDESLTGGSNFLTFSVPSDAAIGNTFARFRFSINGGQSYDGLAPDGEVEDCQVEIKEDIPDNFTEIDVFVKFCGSFDLLTPTGEVIHFTANGEATQAVYFEGSTDGIAYDDDSDSREEVVTELLDLNLTGYDPTLGAINVGISSTSKTLGQIIEHTDLNTGNLDLPPFTMGTDSADSFFDVFFEIEVGGNKLRNNTPKRVSGKISHKPQNPGESYEDCTQIDLFDAADNPTDYILGCTKLIPQCTVELDTFDQAGGELELATPQGTSTIMMRGTVLQAVYFEGPNEGDASDDDGNGLDEVHTEMLSLNLTGESSVLGTVNLSLADAVKTFGQLEETVNHVNGKLDIPPFNGDGNFNADSFFDVTYEIELEGEGGGIAERPDRVEGVTTEKPAAPGDSLNGDCIPRELYDSEGNPTGIYINCFRLRPRLALDYGDAPDPAYPTLKASNGAVHIKSSKIHLGSKIDAERDGQPDPNAKGDNSNGIDDEEGVVFGSTFIPDNVTTIQVTTFNALSTTAYLNAWIDFNSDGDWSDTDEQIIVNQPTGTGTMNVSFSVPASAVTGYTFARFRYSNKDSLSFDGKGGVGEVEDYRIEIKEEVPDDSPRKWSQPPTYNSDSPYPKSFWGWDEASIYEKIIVADDWLCSNKKPVTDIHWWGSYQAWQENVPPSNAPHHFHIGIWKDVPAGEDKEFSHPGDMIKEWFVSRHELNERIVGSDFHPDYMEMPDSCYKYDFYIPEDDVFIQEGDSTIYWVSIAAVYKGIPDQYQWGWKTRKHYFNDDAVRIKDPTAPKVGSAYADGEPIIDLKNNSWDMAFELTTTEVEESLDFGDAPDGVSFVGYPTLLPSGAHHVMAGPWFGTKKDIPDAEANGQPDATATGDDSDGNDDENGITLPTLYTGDMPTIQVEVNGGGGIVNAWIDFDGDKVWQAGEQIINGFLADGTHSISITVPGSAKLGQTFARFRINSIGAVGPTGFASDGEVEDHKVEIREKTTGEEDPRKWSQPPTYNPDSPHPKSFWGWDEVSIRKEVVVADDWLCTDDRPITDIHWWGSYHAWEDSLPPENTPYKFQIGLWKDVPAGADQDFSHPGEMVWEWTVDLPQLNERKVGTDFHPDYMEEPDACFRYDFYIPEDEWYYQQGDSNVYWISIAAVYEAFPEKYPWGWKTRKHFFNDDAVRIFYPNEPAVGSIYKEGMPIKDLNGNSWDMAFILTTNQAAGNYDLGDAPDSLNHTGMSMNAYPGVAARFATVYQTTNPSLPHGPIHWDPKAVAFLGEHVTLEEEADQGADEDPTNNIDPLNDKADLDLADDGVLMPLSLPHCQRTQFEYTVNVVSPATTPFYVNVWFDWNRDGDWNDTLTCGNQATYEWSVPNQLVSVANKGIFTFKTNHFIPWHPNGLMDTTALWMRITLSEKNWIPGSSDTKNGGDGPASGYQYGETEDYYFVPTQDEEIGLEYGDAPEGALAYPSLNVMGNFPTCKSVSTAGYIEHGNRGWLYFGYSVDHEPDGNGGLCPTFNPNLYNQDETAGDSDCGVDLKIYTIEGPIGSETVVPIIPSYAGPMGKPCELAIWGNHINLWWHNGSWDSAYVNILFDWNQDGEWGGQESCSGTSVPEHVLQNFPVPSGNGYMGVLSPPSFRIGPKTGHIWARFTTTPEPINLPWDGSGVFEDGETEDHLVLVGEEDRMPYDYADAPDSSMSALNYPTRFLDNGARHRIDTTIYLGSKIDPDIDGQPQILAKGDDNDGNDDEDGVSFISQLIPGQTAQLVVTASIDGLLSAWIDFNDDGDWADASDLVFNNIPIPQGNKQLSFFVPGAASTSRTFARFRFSQDTIPGYTGEASNGEVEDYVVKIKPEDDITPRKWSQPPQTNADSPFPDCYWGWDELSILDKQVVADDWLCTDNRPVTDIHWWGSYEGWDSDSIPAIVPHTFLIHIWTDVPKSINNSFSHPGVVIHEWVEARSKLNERRVGCDFYPVNMDKPDACFKYDFIIPKDEWFIQEGDSNIYWISITAIYAGVPDEHRWGWKTTAYQNIDYAVKISDPTQPIVGSTYVSGTPILDIAGNYWDMAFELTTNEITGEFDFGDAPEKPYPTRSINNGPYHKIDPNLFLGNGVDPDPDGQPTSDAMGDDLIDSNDDEDGVVFNSDIIPGNTASLTITASDSGFLNAWMDFNVDGDWNDLSETIFAAYLLTPGGNNLTFTVPNTAVIDTSFARFRFSSLDSLWYTGYAPDGEVEDYWIDIVKSSTSIQSIGNIIPKTFDMSQNYPNPFNPSTKIRFDLPKTVNVKITVYNLLGQEVKILLNENKQAGSYIVEWNGQNNLGSIISTGIYLYHIEAGNFTDTKKFIFMK